MIDINTFLETQLQDEQEYKYRMLIYGNYTFRENLEADSLVVVLRNVLPYLSKKYSIHFDILIPQSVTSLEFPNTNQIIYELPTYCNQMRTHFNSVQFMNIIDWKRKHYDIIYSHLPEHTAQIANCIYNNTDLQPSIIGYSHWFEVKENAPYPKNMLMSSYAGLLEMEECGVNSKWLKELLLSYAEKQLAPPLIKKLEKIVQPHYLGVDQIRPRNKKIEHKSVIFNHRQSGYTGWEWFVSVMDELWTRRQDFKVYTTLAHVDRPWCRKVDTPTREEYMNLLHRMQFGVGCFQDYSAWSISVTDGLSVNVPYLLPNKFCYPEMVSADYPYLYGNREEFITKFEQMLDTPPTYDTTAIAQSMIWENRISTWFNGWDGVFSGLKKVKNSKQIDNIISFIRKNKSVTKQDILNHLGWGVNIKFDPYRHYLRDVPEIKFTKDRYIWKI